MIYITETLRIAPLDGLNLQLEELCEIRNKKTGDTRKEWKWLGYYGDLRSALVGALKKQLFNAVDGDTKMDLQAVVLEIDNATERIIKALKEKHENDKH